MTNTLYLDARGYIRGELDGESVNIDETSIPRDKKYRRQNRARGFCGHSMVWTEVGAMGRFSCTKRLPNGRYTSYCAASVMFTNPQVGVPTQHFSIWDATWTSGGKTYPDLLPVGSEANTNLANMEMGGGMKSAGYDEPPTPSQHKWTVAIVVLILTHQKLEPKYTPDVGRFNNYFGEDRRF